MLTFPAGYHPLEQELNRKVLAAAYASGMHVYLVGGYVRDALAGRLSGRHAPLDFDYAVCGGKAFALARALAVSLPGHFVALDEALDTARVVLDTGDMVDLAGCVGPGIESDILRRDFTINALAWDPEAPDKIIDLPGGLQDLKTLTVRAINEQNLVDDPLRMLRAFRFATTLGGTIDEATLAMVKRRAALLSLSAGERISYELFAVMGSESAGSALKSMGETGVLEIIFPELSATRKVPPNAFHHLGLWDHSLETAVQAERNLSGVCQWVRDDLASELSPGISRGKAMKVACLLHDIGKPETWQITPEGRHSFIGHEKLGEAMCEQLAARLRWSRQVSRFIANLVGWHLRPGQLFHQGQPSEKAVLRFYRKMGQAVPALIILACGDLAATCGPGLEGPGRLYLENGLTGLLEQYPAFLESQKNVERLLDGHDIMRMLKIGPGPGLGEILQALSEAQVLGQVKTRADAEQFVAGHYGKKSGH